MKAFVMVGVALWAVGCSSQVDSTSTSAPLSGSCNAIGQSALAYEASKLATNSMSDECLGLVQLAFHRAEPYLADSGCSDTAADSLACARKTAGWTAWDGSCPCGAILYWAGNECNGEDGHVVICNGDGTASTAGWPGFGGSTHASISWLDKEECNNEPAGYIVPGGAPAPACVAGGVADFDGDGKSDVLVRGVSGWDTTPVFLSQGNGAFTYSDDVDPTKSIFNAAGSQAFVGDFNGDGKTDVLVKGVSGWETTPVFFSKGDGTFTFSNAPDPTKTLFNVAGTQTLLGDFNGDGRTDVVLRHDGWTTTPVFFSNGDGTFSFSNAADPTKTLFNLGGAQTLVGDFNGDGKTDVIVRGVSGWDTTLIFFSKGDGTFTFSNVVDPGKTIFNTTDAQTFVGDFDGDGKSDVLLRRAGWNTTPMYLANSDGSFRYSNAPDPTTFFNLASAQAFAGDFDGDGRTDVVVKGVSGWDTTLVFFSNANGTFRVTNAPDPSKTIFNFVGAETLLGDFNGDGKTDVLMKNGPGWNTTPLFVSKGDGTFSYTDDSNAGGTVFNFSGASTLCY